MQRISADRIRAALIRANPPNRRLSASHLSGELASPAGAAGDTGDPGEPEWLWHGHIPSLDGLRAVAILLVLLSHAARTQGFPVPSHLGRFLTPLGLTGVNLFFVISGFLITLLLLREQRKKQRISLKNFYIRRAFRILPASAAFLLTVAALHCSGAVRIPARDWLSALTYTINFRTGAAWELDHFWSLSVEEHFYLGWPLLFLLAGVQRVRVLLCACVLMAPLVRWQAPHYCPGRLNLVHCTFSNMDSIAIGCLLAFIASSPALRVKVRLTEAKVLGAAVAITILLVLNKFALPRCSWTLAQCWGPTLEALGFAALIWVCIHAGRGSVLGLFLNCTPAVIVGLLSYSIYLWQQLFLDRHRADWFCCWPANIGLVAAAACLSYGAVEKPFLRLKERLRLGRG